MGNEMGNANERTTSSEHLRLFDDRERSDPRPASGSTGSFDFLDRVATPYWAAVRSLLEDWFAEFSRHAMPNETRDVRSRFRSRNGQQHQAAFWELYVFALLRHLFPSSIVAVEKHPRAAAKRPDFAVIAGLRPQLYVEAVSPQNDPVFGPSSALEVSVLDTITSIESRESA